jgi:hypothetical protein
MACLLFRVGQLHFVLAEILQEQKWIIAVLFMVPVYASESVSNKPHLFIWLIEAEKCYW